MSENGGIRGFIRALSRPTFVRTCSNCGYRWEVSKYYSKPHPKGFPVLGGGPSTASSFNEVATSNESMADAVAQLSTCAECQSKRFTQKRMWHMSKAEYDDA